MSAAKQAFIDSVKRALDHDGVAEWLSRVEYADALEQLRAHVVELARKAQLEDEHAVCGELTADTLTDEHIRELLVEYLHAKPFADSYGVDLCDEALGRQSRYKQHAAALKPDADAIRRARARCAAILNARRSA